MRACSSIGFPKSVCLLPSGSRIEHEESATSSGAIFASSSVCFLPKTPYRVCGGSLFVPESEYNIIQLVLASARLGSTVFDGVLTLVVGAGPSLAASRELELPQPTAAEQLAKARSRMTRVGYFDFQ